MLAFHTINVSSKPYFVLYGPNRVLYFSLSHPLTFPFPVHSTVVSGAILCMINYIKIIFSPSLSSPSSTLSVSPGVSVFSLNVSVQATNVDHLNYFSSFLPTVPESFSSRFRVPHNSQSNFFKLDLVYMSDLL